MQQNVFTIHLPCDDDISSHARAELTQRLNGAVVDRRGDLHLLVSELVTNGVEHGTPDDAGQLELRVDAVPERVRVEVLDAGEGFEFDPRRPEPDGETSFGLFLVDRMSDCWGFDVQGGRTRVWFELSSASN
jgi:anti-sigma regulatory factor (Ser/Thr protein kinase)